MFTQKKYLSLLVLVLISGCVHRSNITTNDPITRHININGVDMSLTGKKASTFICKNRSYSKNIMAEFGIFFNENNDDIGAGYVLFEGGSKGQSTGYYRNGLDRVWFWGEDPYSYEFHLSADGWGKYYNFSFIPEGEKIKPDDVWQCFR